MIIVSKEKKRKGKKVLNTKEQRRYWFGTVLSPPMLLHKANREEKLQKEKYKRKSQTLSPQGEINE